MLRELLDHPQVTEVCELRSRFGVMAYHGGNLERGTDAVAREVAGRAGASYYALLQQRPLRRHLSSTHFDPSHSKEMTRFFDHVDVVITIHGYGRRGYWRHLLLGGRNRALARHVAAHLRDGLPRRYSVLDELEALPEGLRGQHVRNPVNRPPQHGVQIELPPSIRWNMRAWGWSGHEGVPHSRELDRLIDALSAAVSAWSVEV